MCFLNNQNCFEFFNSLSNCNKYRCYWTNIGKHTSNTNSLPRSRCGGAARGGGAAATVGGATGTGGCGAAGGATGSATGVAASNPPPLPPTRPSG